MSIEPQPSSKPISGSAAPAQNAWMRLLAWIEAFEDALNTSYDEIQDRRILALELDVARLKQRLDATAIDDPYRAELP